MMEMINDRRVLAIFRKIKLEYAKQAELVAGGAEVLGQTLYSELFFKKATQQYILRTTVKKDWLYLDKELILATAKQRAEIFNGRIKALTPLVLVEDSQAAVKVIMDSRVLSSGLVVLKLQQANESVVLSPTNLMLFLKYIKHPVTLTEV
ncbi:hypothetical protein [Liquorilactobacillus satsumensis]|nr:hypothetical protein [Liquorilactobacillus satsumensis]MCC7666487.1 hypothetical protein [Liquorilactobacillus satsumensis]MCP9312573.1 hypothetical protein [Liquorilactobacillus satsumensis]MCP9328880.1 hypothetical protein [Liquorilactobacillus satsumensis]MCP9356774.1 hypothetical protein [Liquorilactobacillus satsumensis]MCP9360330.1 hypothetical protein [Liquorilactobacillus satsumensis]